MDFNPGAGTDTTFGLTVAPGATLTFDLQWAEAWFGVGTNLDAFLLDANGNPVEAGGVPVAGREDNVNGTQKPVEIFQWENRTGSAKPVQLAINRFSGGSPRLKFALLENGGGVTSIEYPTSANGDVVGPTIFGHNGGADTMSVGAVRFNTNSAPESFSSRGPVTHYFGPVTGGLARIADLTRARAQTRRGCHRRRRRHLLRSCVSNAWRFFGTSAAAPHAAAVAALELERGTRSHRFARSSRRRSKPRPKSAGSGSTRSAPAWSTPQPRWA